MTKKEVINLQNTLRQAEQLKGKSENMVKFRYAIAKNITRIDEEVKTLQKAVSPKPEYTVYDNARIVLCETHANKDEKGKSIIKGNAYDLMDESGVMKVEFTEAWEALKLEHKPALDARDAQIEDYNKLLEEASEVELYKFSVEVIPDDISGPLMKSLFPFLMEE
jgi:hypothetical protein